MALSIGSGVEYHSVRPRRVQTAEHVRGAGLKKIRWSGSESGARARAER